MVKARAFNSFRYAIQNDNVGTSHLSSSRRFFQFYGMELFEPNKSGKGANKKQERTRIVQKKKKHFIVCTIYPYDKRYEYMYTVANPKGTRNKINLILTRQQKYTVKSLLNSS